MSDYESKYLTSFNDFVEKNENIDVEWSHLLDPIYTQEEENFFGFIISYIFM